MGRPRLSVEEKIWAKVLKTDTCWLWQGKPGTTGYSKTTVFREGKVHHTSGHRAVYELVVGPIPEGMFLDHKCGVKMCVNPDHLEPVTPGENTRRWSATITHCAQGHPFDEANTAWLFAVKDGYETWQRVCRICAKEKVARYRSRNPEKIKEYKRRPEVRERENARRRKKPN